VTVTIDAPVADPRVKGAGFESVDVGVGMLKSVTAGGIYGIILTTKPRSKGTSALALTLLTTTTESEVSSEASDWTERV
jgi:hypothetical protein